MKLDLPRFALVLLVAGVMGVSVAALTTGPIPEVSPDEVLNRAAANERMLKAAEREFYYRQDILVQTFGEANSVRAQLHRVSEMTYDSSGNRTEKIIEYPPSPLSGLIGVLQPDFKSIFGVDQYFLMPDLVSSYSIKFSGRRKVDDLSTYVFDVEPADVRHFPKRDKNDHPFKGTVWIDEQDFQIVKFEGRAVIAKDENARYPKFECYRENIERGIWLPSLAYARDVLDLKRVDLPIKVEIKYTGYKRIKPRG